MILLSFVPLGLGTNVAVDFFGIANTYRDQVGGAAAPRTGADELERVKGEARAIAEGKKEAAARQVMDMALNLRNSMQGYGGGVRAGSTANYSAMGPRTGSPRNEGWGQLPSGGTVEANRKIAQMLAEQRGWTGDLWSALDRLIMKESGYKNTAQNPTSTAFGIGQFLDSTWKNYGEKTADPRTQLDYMFRYIQDRYGDPARAWQFSQANNWY